ncbi:MAG: hypothetical protein COU90_00150 [Candidatus Ryanbacteria bacterium CG10_big_fil_rev_8_21_14_0_10_43_42]|uniref:DUF5666 domain-containing protein n=1 Tax=Candidatus Ryanbacteria bacterium CG10_big_fil_rev_8_21_14_0_10_43_42 TaxID=1974864 RepID=A0A2M8KYC4_9BACT|nr:MAG: hypothetical protein COU90_00150 [Candidatus Ryanbacteria bacterium CG10_big_fil_rev_8_21_14_0_10_43_42]
MKKIATLLAVAVMVGTLSADALAENTAQLESPADGSTISGIAPIQGWVAADSNESVEVIITIDNFPPSTAACCTSRRDVEALHPNAGLVGGFTATMNWGVIRSGTHTVRMEVHFQPRGTVVQTNTITVLRPADRAFIPNLDLTTAEVSLVGDTVMIDGIYVPSDANGAITEKEDVHVGLRWNSATQSFGIVETN